MTTENNLEFPDLPLSAQDMMKAFGGERIVGLISESSYLRPPHPELEMDAATQVKLHVVSNRNYSGVGGGRS